MKHIDLNTQAEAIKQFFLSLPKDPEGALVEMNGRALTRLVPIESSRRVAPDQWTAAMDVRRCFLIDREIDGSLTPEEGEELAQLQRLMSDHLDRVAPLPLKGTRELYNKLLSKAEATPLE